MFVPNFRLTEFFPLFVNLTRIRQNLCKNLHWYPAWVFAILRTVQNESKNYYNYFGGIRNGKFIFTAYQQDISERF